MWQRVQSHKQALEYFLLRKAILFGWEGPLFYKAHSPLLDCKQLLAQTLFLKMRKQADMVVQALNPS